MVLWDGGGYWVQIPFTHSRFTVYYRARGCVRACMRMRVRVCVRVCACGRAHAGGRPRGDGGGGCVHARICRSPPNLREAKLEKVGNNNSPQALAISDVG
mgnify:CR=1 FL=1